MIDAHHHFWTYNAPEFSWVTDDMAVLRQDFLPRQLEEAVAGTGVSGVVTVQAKQSVEETEWLLGLAGCGERIKGVVGWVPLKDPGVGAILDRLRENARFCGVREIVQGAPDAGFFDSPDFHRGLRELTARDCPYDLLVFQNQLASATRFVDAHPGQRFILDHLAKPEIRGERPPPEWERGLRELAKRQNVFCKFSGVVTEVREGDWSVERLRPYFETALEAFGSKRLLFGSDWPVCLLRSGYAAWVAAVRELAASLSEPERAAFFGETACAAYGLKG